MSAPIFHNFNEAPTQVAPFSHAVECDGWIQLTGQMPTDPNDDDRPLAEGIELQTRRVMDNLVIVLRGLGLGLEHVLWSSDYPHNDSTWPRSQAMIDRLMEGVPDDERRMIVSANAAALYGFK